MFAEDMTNGVVSFYRRHRHDRTPVIFLEMDDGKALENKVSQMLGSNRGDFGDAVCELMRQTAWLLYLDGEARALLNGFRNEGNQLDYSLQLTNPNDIGMRKSKEWFRTHTIEFPESLGGKRSIRKIVKRIGDLGDNFFPEFTIDSLRSSRGSEFDVNEYSMARYLEIARLTRNLGWNQRSHKETTEWYFFCRYTREVRSQIIVRDHILEWLNEILNGPPINMGVKIKLRNALTLAQVEEQLDALQQGLKTFDSLYTSLK